MGGFMGVPGSNPGGPMNKAPRKTVLADAVREVGNGPDFSVRYGKSNSLNIIKTLS